jgi:hypothetical protein
VAPWPPAVVPLLPDPPAAPITVSVAAVEPAFTVTLTGVGDVGTDSGGGVLGTVTWKVALTLWQMKWPELPARPTA